MHRKKANKECYHEGVLVLRRSWGPRPYTTPEPMLMKAHWVGTSLLLHYDQLWHAGMNNVTHTEGISGYMRCIYAYDLRMQYTCKSYQIIDTLHIKTTHVLRSSIPDISIYLS